MVQIVEPSCKFEAITPDPELLIERLTRKCYQSDHVMDCDWKIANSPCSDGYAYSHMKGWRIKCPKCEERAGKFILRLLKRGHTPPLGHASASFTFVTDRGITHELVRHRLADYCQESTRYCNYGKDRFGQEITVIRPPEIVEPTTEQQQLAGAGGEAARIAVDNWNDWMEAMRVAEGKYLRMIGRGMKPEMARSVLPTCLKTEISMTCNMVQWRHVLSQRSELNQYAHPQIREIIEKARAVLKEHAPNVFSDR